METTQFTTTVLTAAEGHVLTQADESTPIERRAVSSKVYLGLNDSPDNWKEITVAEGMAIIEEQRIANSEQEGDNSEQEGGEQ